MKTLTLTATLIVAPHAMAQSTVDGTLADAACYTSIAKTEVYYDLTLEAYERCRDNDDCYLLDAARNDKDSGSNMALTIYCIRNADVEARLRTRGKKVMDQLGGLFARIKDLDY